MARILYECDNQIEPEIETQKLEQLYGMNNQYKEMGNNYQDQVKPEQSTTYQINKPIHKDKKHTYHYPMKNAYPILMRLFFKHLETLTQQQSGLNEKQLQIALEINRILRQATNNHGEKLLWAFFNLDYSHIPVSWAFYKEQLINFLTETNHQLRRDGLNDQYKQFRQTFIENVKNPKQWKFSARGRKSVDITSIAEQIKMLRESETIDVKHEQPQASHNTPQTLFGVDFATLQSLQSFQFQYIPCFMMPVQIPQNQTTQLLTPASFTSF